MNVKIKTYLLPIVLGILGTILGFGIWQVGFHIWMDHQNIHALVGIEAKRINEANQLKSPEKGSNEK